MTGLCLKTFFAVETRNENYETETGIFHSVWRDELCELAELAVLAVLAMLAELAECSIMFNNILLRFQAALVSNEPFSLADRNLIL